MTARVLVVEDDAQIRRLLQTVLGREGLDVEVTGDGAEALEWIRPGRFGVVILDLMLLGLSGYDVLAACASMPLPRPVFLVTTAFDSAPFDVPVLGAIVREAARAWPHLPVVIPRTRGVVPAALLGEVPDAEASH